MKKRSANKQIFMITDGKPSMITRNDGTLYKNPFGLDPIVVNRTLDEAIICRKKRIPITTFMIADDPYLKKIRPTAHRVKSRTRLFCLPDEPGRICFLGFPQEPSQSGVIANPRAQASPFFNFR